MPKMTASLRANIAWQALTMQERWAFHNGELGRSAIVARFGEAFNTSDRGGHCTTAWSHLTRLHNEWAAQIDPSTAPAPTITLTFSVGEAHKMLESIEFCADVARGMRDVPPRNALDLRPTVPALRLIDILRNRLQPSTTETDR